MVPLELSSQSFNTVMPANMVAPAPMTSMSLNLDEKKAQKKAEEEKKKKTLYTYVFFGFSALALVFYSVYFFYPNLVAYLKAPDRLEQIEQETAKKSDALMALQEEKSLHQAAYEEETQREAAMVDVVFPPYNKQKIIRDIENAINTLELLGTFEMNSITLESPVPQSLGWVTFVSGNFRASKPTFDAFIESYVGNSGNLEDSNSTIIKEIKQMSVKPTQIQSVRTGTNQKVTEEGFTVNFKLAFYTRPETK